MGTRGLLGIRNNKGWVCAYYNQYDSYYGGLGRDVLQLYFNGSGIEICDNLLKDEDRTEDNREFIDDGLFCEYAYVYNRDNDTLEIYRGFFQTRQELNDKEKDKELMLDKLEGKKEEEYYSHLIMIVDRKIHTEKQVLKAFHTYEEHEEELGDKTYPERNIIPLVLPKNYRRLTK